MADFDITDGFRKVFLASVGAVATTAEKSQEVIDGFVKKGELTVAQGKAINEELTRKAKEVVGDTSDAALRAKMEAMTPGACGLCQEGCLHGIRHRCRRRRAGFRRGRPR